MADHSAVDVRVRYLEQLSKQLTDQVRVMKQLVTTEVADLKNVMQLQVSEVKQIVMHQDRVYQERIRRLESRVEQLSEFCMQLARSTGTSGALRNIPADILGGGDGTGGGGSPAASPSRSLIGGGGGGGGGDDDDDDVLPGVEGVIAKYREKLESIYTFYTTSNIQVFHPAMTLAHFARLCKDCHLCGFDSGTPAELLWMAIMRKLGAKRRRRQASSARHATTISTGKFTNKKTNLSFAYERLDEIPKEAFPEALYILAMEKIGRNRSDMPAEHLFETFLVTDIFPNVDSKMEMFRVLPDTDPTRDGAGSAMIQDYKTEEVKSVVKEYMSRLRESFKVCVQTQDYRDTAMTLDGFVEFVRRHDLMSLISKPDVRQIFIVCAAIEQQRNKEAKPDTMTMPSFMLAVYHLADRIYGDRLYLDKYPTPEARVRKLMSKMFLLK